MISFLQNVIHEEVAYICKSLNLEIYIFFRNWFHQLNEIIFYFIWIWFCWRIVFLFNVWSRNLNNPYQLISDGRIYINIEQTIRIPTSKIVIFVIFVLFFHKIVIISKYPYTMINNWIGSIDDVIIWKSF